MNIKPGLCSPPAESPRREWTFATPLHALYLYGACGLTAYGWAYCQILGWEARPWLPLWFCAALFIYNVDRLLPDPADGANLPLRAQAMRRLRSASQGLTVIAAAGLVGLPLLRRDGTTLALVLAGAVTCLNYSVPIRGFRLKDLPIAKTFLAPTIVTLAIFVLPWLHEGPRVATPILALAALHAWGLLLFNMLLCDQRDVGGDSRCGTLSLPIFLGRSGTRWLLLGLLAGLEILSLASSQQTAGESATAWRTLALLELFYLGGLLVALRTPRSERFYEWWVEGLFFLPALAVLGGGVV